MRRLWSPFCPTALAAAPLCDPSLQRWRDLVIETDPDIIIGYNIVNFDLPYLIDRAETLKISDFPYWGRITRKWVLPANRRSWACHAARSCVWLHHQGHGSAYC